MSDSKGAAIRDKILEVLRGNTFSDTWPTPYIKSQADKLEAILAQEVNKARLAGRLSEAEEWASFFEDPSMDSYTPSERLHKRAKDLRN